MLVTLEEGGMAFALFLLANDVPPEHPAIAGAQDLESNKFKPMK